MVMGNYKNSGVFNFAVLLKSQKSRKFDAYEIYMFYSILYVHLLSGHSLKYCMLYLLDIIYANNLFRSRGIK